MKKIFRNYNPIIELFYAYVGMDGESAFGKDYDVYLEMVVKLKETVCVAVNRVMKNS